MKKTVIVLIVLFLGFIALNSYVSSFGDDIDQKKMEKINEKENEKKLMEEALLKKCQQAKTAMDLKEELSKMIGDEIVYRETEETNDILMYYPLLDRRDEYIILSKGEKEYVLFYYWMSSYSEKLKDIVSITKEYTNPNQTTLRLNVETITSNKKTKGDFPHISYARCLIELDRKITCLVVNGFPYHQYDGGLVNLGSFTGVLDRDYNFIEQPIYDMLREYDTCQTNMKYYFISTQDGNGLMDEKYKIILDPKNGYGNIFYVNDNKFIVVKDKQEGSGLDTQIGIVDRQENVIHEYIDGFIDGDQRFDDENHQAVFGRIRDGETLFGIIDDELNIILEPEYDHINEYDNIYYVTNRNWETARFDQYGNQLSEFKKD